MASSFYHPSQTAISLKVMIVDDSPDIRGFVTQLFNKTPGIILAASASDGAHAIDIAKKLPLDAIILDADMPGMDGLTALPHLLNILPQAHIILMSDRIETQTIKNIKSQIKETYDYIQKPLNVRNSTIFGQTLIERLCFAKSTANSNQVVQNTMPRTSEEAPVITLRKRPKFLIPQAIAIGSSTGGPEALVKLFKNMARHIIHSPVFITQHIPASFTALLASHIQEACGNRCIQPEDGELINPATIYLAPGDFHMEVKKHEDGQLRVCLTKAPPEHSCRPSVNPMLRSLVEIYGHRILAVILTGMGHDGLEGCKVLSEVGGIILAQDQASSIVWGMPGTVAMQGLCTAILPIDNIASYIRDVMGSRL